MARAQIALVMCQKCNAWYSSERALDNHNLMFHRVFDSEEKMSQPSAIQCDTVTEQRVKGQERSTANVR